jgi:hypothetical protein
MRKLSPAPRRNSGVTSIVEFGPTLWLVLIMFTFPLLAFGTIGIRYCFVNNATQYAAEAGACSSSFSANITQSGVTYLSSINAAQKVITTAQQSWTGITPGTIVTSIVITPFAGGTITSQTTPLTSAQMAVQAKNLYTCQVSVPVTIQPLFPQQYFQGALACPGLTVPLSTTCTSSRIFEYPQGLNQ